MPYIYLDRDIVLHPLWTDKPFARGQAWVDLILLARYTPSQAYIRGLRIDLARGELAMSQELLAERWGWSRGKVARFLDDMKVNQEIDKRQHNRIDIITICKYEDYQSKAATNRTTNGQQTGGERSVNGAHNKEGKERKKDIGKPDSVSESVWHDFLVLRKNKKAPVTQTVIDGIESEAASAGITLEAALAECCTRGWQSFKAEWRNKPTPFAKPVVVKANVKTY